MGKPGEHLFHVELEDAHRREGAASSKSGESSRQMGWELREVGKIEVTEGASKLQDNELEHSTQVAKDIPARRTFLVTYEAGLINRRLVFRENDNAVDLRTFPEKTTKSL